MERKQWVKKAVEELACKQLCICDKINKVTWQPMVVWLKIYK